MIRVRLGRTGAGSPSHLWVTGHANQGVYGEDIVCAAVSALVETLMLGLTRVAQEVPAGTVDPGRAELIFHRPISVEARAIIETMVVGLQDLAQSEPKAVRFEEVFDDRF